MPIYEYRRPDGTTFDVLQSFADATLTHDPETGVPVEKVFHAPAIHFKGKGFHNTDYGTRNRNRELESSGENGANNHSEKSKDKREKAGSDSSTSSTSSPDSGSSTSSSSESKPAAAKGDKAAVKKDTAKT
jgi:putative FmdB family regulatory protein